MVTQPGQVDVPSEPTEVFYVEEEVVSCDGGDGPLGHPRIWLNMEGNRKIDCPYCGRRFVLKGHEDAEPVQI